MSTITTRAGKGSPLTNAEVDANFTNLNTDKAELSGATFTGDVASTGFSGDITGAILFQAKAGEALTKGDPVYISGISGNQTVVSKADANDANKMPCFGIVDATVSINANCSVVTFGTLSSLDTSAFGEGDELYISDTGTLSTAAPTGEASQLQKIAKVTRSHASAGSIKVMGAGRTNATPNLDDGKFFLGNSSNQSASATFSTSVTGIALPLSGGAMTGAITTNSTFDGRDVATDGSKLDGIESGATADQTAAEIKTAYESNADTNAFTDADESKLDGIEAGADVTDTNTVTSAGALMDSELTSIASVKALNQGVATTDSPTFAGLTVDTNTLYVDSTNNRVGIGTSSPAKLLHLSESADGAKLRITRAGVSEWDFSIGNTSTLTGVGAGALEILPQVGGTSNELAIGTAGSAVPLVHITNSQNYFKNKVGIGTSSPSTKLHLGGTAPLDSIIRQDSTVSGTNWEIGEREADKWQIWEDDSDSVVATFMSSGRVGIGTSSPTETLTVVDSSSINNGTIHLGGASYYASISQDAVNDGGVIYNSSAAAGASHGHKFHVDGSARMVINGSGNVGINNSSPVEMLTIGSTSDTNVRAQFLSSTTGANTIQFGDGTGASAYSGYINYTHSDNALVFATSSTERMRISSAGHTMFATTDDAPGAGNTQSGVAIRGGSDNRSFFSASSNYAMHLNRNTNDGEILYFAKNGTAVGSIGTNAATMYVSAPQAGGMKYSYYNSTNAVMLPVTTTGAYADGLHDLGYSAARFKDLWVTRTHIANNGSSYWTLDRGDGDGSLTFEDTGTERMRIDPYGRVLVNTTDDIGGARFNVEHPTDCIGCNLGPSASGTRYFMYFTYNGTNVGSIRGGPTSTAFTTSSDQRLKENIADADDASSKVDAIQVRQFDWKADGSHQDYGMIAQELQAVAPEAVFGDADSEKMMGVDYSKLVPMLIKEIQSLRNRVAQLEE